MGAYGAANLEPARWRRVVTMAVPPSGVVGNAFFSYDQLRLSWYMFFLQHPLAEMVLPLDGHDFIAKLWRDWSPGYDAAEDLAHFVACVPDAAISTTSAAAQAENRPCHCRMAFLIFIDFPQ